MNPALQLTRGLDDLRRRLEFGDLVLLLYISAFVRQYLWIIRSPLTAWALTTALTLLFWFWHLRSKEEAQQQTPALFWFVVVPPLLFFYALRAALPDMSWDVLDYRIVNGELALGGWPMRPGDFFPSRFPFNPAPDMVMGISRKLLGYRLGTIVNLAALIWTGLILERLLRPFIKRAGLRSFGILLLLLTEQLLFEINNYMVDVVALPLLLEATRLCLATPPDKTQQRRMFIRMGLYLGASLAFKLTNLAFVAPLVLLCAYRMWRGELPLDMRATLYGSAALLAPLLPYTFYIYQQTGNPLFPLYNRVFQSPYWPTIDPRAERWGPVVDDKRFNSLKLWEQLVWPLLVPFRIEHAAGALGPHWGRLSVGFLASLAALLWRRADSRIRSLAFVTLLGSVIWGVATGMPRYAAYLEVVGGIIALYLILALMGKTLAAIEQRYLRLTAALLLTCVLVAQSASSCVYGFNFEWGSRPSFFQQPREHLYEVRYILRDRSPHHFLSPEERALFESVEVWVESAPMTSGLQTTLRPSAPLLCVYMDEFLQTETARERFGRTLEESRGKAIYTLSLTDWLKFSSENLKRARLGVGKIKTVSLPYYSDRARFHTLHLMEVLPLGHMDARELEITAAGGPLREDAYSASLSWTELPPLHMLRRGERRTIRITLRNSGGSVWPALGLPGGQYRILAGNHWLDTEGHTIINDDARAPLPFDLAVGQEVELPLTITAPREEGEYILEVDMVQEGFTWFAAKGSKTLRVKVAVGD